MEKAELFPHNEIAYQKLCEALKNNRCATINHATGTGKSFITLKYLYENNDKKFLYLAPTYPIIEQLKESCYKIGITPKDINIDTMIYRSLLEHDMENIFQKYDGIIFDEYHRAGAPKTYKKIKELKHKLINSDGTKKFIGLTATPIRYLDHERNMTSEIFDNVVASTLPLSDAMIDGLLPVPIYINSKISCRKEYQKQLRKLEVYPPIPQKARLLKELNEIGKKIDNGYTDNANMINKYVTKKDGKYIVFCTNIDKLNYYYKEIDLWFEKFGNIKKYKVHSGIKKEVNQRNLNQFNKEQGGISVLFCVDILNEGIHVDDIDGVILLRKTTSPIIYFQQIGRALSFSGRNRQIKIFDLVNNYQNHNAIDLVYQEYEEEINKRIAEHPEKEKEYKAQLNKFKIKNETDAIMKQLSKISDDLSKEKVIAAKIDYSIEQLEFIVKQIDNSKGILKNPIAKNAYENLAELYKYVNTEQFLRLQELNIVLPIGLSYTVEEREKQLSGYDSIYEKEKNMSNDVIKSLIQFIEKEGRNVRINSENTEEKNLAMKYLYFLPNFKDKQLVELKNKFEKNNIQFQSYEKVLYNVEFYEEDIEDIIERAQKYLNQNYTVPDFLLDAIKKVVYNYDLEQDLKLLEIIEHNKELIKQKNNEKNQKRYEHLNEILDILEKNQGSSPEELEKKGIFKMLESLSITDMNYIKSKYTRMKSNYYKKLFGLENQEQLQDFKRNSKEQDDEILTELMNKAKEEMHNYAILKKYILFLMRNNGNKPDSNSKKDEEKQLALECEKIMEDDELKRKIEQVLSDESILLYKPEIILFDIFDKQYDSTITKNDMLKNIYITRIQEYYKTVFNIETFKDMEQFCTDAKNINIKQIGESVNTSRITKDAYYSLKRYIDFMINTNGQKPNENSQDIEEKNIALNYAKYVKSEVIEDKVSLINIDNFQLQAPVLKSTIEEKCKNMEIKNIVLENIEFLLKNMRRPLKNSSNEKERNLANEYENKCVHGLNDRNLDILNSLFNSRKYLLNTSIQFAKNNQEGR